MPVSHLLDAADWYVKGEQLLQEVRVEAALECFSMAQQLGFDEDKCAASRWNCWMLSGRFERAWQESDRIEALGVLDPHRYWDGRAWNGRCVMLRCLHGLGDTIQFIRYAPLLRRTCSRLTVQTHPQLTTLLEGVAGIDQVCTWGAGHLDCADGWDIQMEVTELPRAFRATVDSLPARVPYIHIPEERRAWAAGRFSEKRRGLRIGLCWRSGPWNPHRSVTLDELAPLFALGGHQFFSLQKERDAVELQAAYPLTEFPADALGVRDVGALIVNLDLVITVDTMTAHLAGALGRPVWILLPFPADWRWMLARRDSPWYPTARLFRQMPHAPWSAVIAEVADELRGLRSRRLGGRPVARVADSGLACYKHRS
ncbi:MAG TPA: hypothetical protein VK604_03705 [Bryobacteraceae bacterium]|nr:hypothetical protein [Bryobacteraceae bacterium]